MAEFEEESRGFEPHTAHAAVPGRATGTVAPSVASPGSGCRETQRVRATTASLAALTDRLRSIGCVAAELEADELLDAATDSAELDRWVARRGQGEPLAWIVGRLRFCDRTIRVSPGVYVPRAHTEELARRAAARLPAGGLAIDLCTGSGAVAHHLLAEVPTARVVGVDLDVRAARCALSNGVPTVVADLDAPLAAGAACDVVTAVAPYVPAAGLRLLPPDVQRHEPRLALDGGDDGLALVRRVLAAAARLLRPGGAVLVEVGGDQDRALQPLLAQLGFDDVEPWRDTDGDLRGIEAHRG